jgi:hypothetical protein
MSGKKKNMYNIGEMRTDGRKVTISNVVVSRCSLHCLKRTIAHIVVWFAFYVALDGLAARGVQAQQVQEPLRLEEILPQIHLELDPNLKITPSINDYADINQGSVMGTEDIPPPEKTNSAEKALTNEKGDIKPDWSGLTRDTVYFMGYQIALIGIIYVLPEAVTGWSDENKDSYDFDRWIENVGKIVWDEDKWYVNYLFHPYWGSIYYIRARERGFEKFDSFLYSAFSSVLFEFGVEAMFEAPSIQDLIATPVLGTFLGMSFEKLRGGIKAKGYQQRWYDKVVLILTDPLGTLNNYTDRLFGIHSTVELKSFRSLPHQYEGININHAKSEEFITAEMSNKSPIGVEVKLAW